MPGDGVERRSCVTALNLEVWENGRDYKRKSIEVLDIVQASLYILNRSLLVRTAIRLVVRTQFFPA